MGFNARTGAGTVPGNIGTVTPGLLERTPVLQSIQQRPTSIRGLVGYIPVQEQALPLGSSACILHKRWVACTPTQHQAQPAGTHRPAEMSGVHLVHQPARSPPTGITRLCHGHSV